ncbi:hypothetical protein [Sorangium sp. So ce1078]|uniref:hypothetical protein n=1 Tax=Sorangium sp. So ce1078 TaxID=3133329 RepID=UPI003F5D6652
MPIATSPPTHLRRAIFIALSLTTLFFSDAAWAQATWTSPECADAGLESPAGTCDGPWRYSWERKCSDPAVCASSTSCLENNTCTTYAAGILTQQRTETPSTQWTESCSCTTSSDCQTRCPPSCNWAASNRRNEIIASVPTSSPNYASWVNGLHVSGTVVNATSTTKLITNLPPARTITHKYSCRLDIHGFPSPGTGAVPACGCKTCVCEQGVSTTTPAPDAPKPSSNATLSVFGETCLTCDDPDFNASSGDASAMLDCLTTRLSPSAGDLREAQTARMKLLLQLAGQSLDEGEREEVALVYDTDPTSGPACQETLPMSASCAEIVGPSGLRISSELQRCAGLGGDHVPIDAIRAELPGCLALLPAIKDVPASSACREPLRDLAMTVVAAMIERAAAQYDVSDGLEDDLVESLVYLDAWYEAVAAIEISEASEDTLPLRSSALVGRIWQSAHDATQPLPFQAGSDAAAAAILADAGSNGLYVDWQMLRAAFHPSQPIDSPPLLLLLGDALRGTADRLERVGAIHDVACRFADCAPPSPASAATVTPTSDAWRAISAIAAPLSVLDDVLDGVVALDGQHAPFVAALEAIRDRRQALEAAWSKASGGRPFSDLLRADAPLPSDAEGLGAVVRAAKASSDSYDATGFFTTTRARLTSAVLQRAELVAFIDQGVAEVGSAVDDFAAARLDTVNDLLAQARAAGQTQSVADRAGMLAEEMVTLLGRLDGLRAREAAEQASLGGFMSAFEAVIESGAFDANAAYQIDTLPQIEISPIDARFEGTFDLNAISASVVTVAAGEILNIDVVDDTWTPTCALDISEIATPEGGLQGIDVSGAVAGPQGYHLSWSNGAFKAHGESTTDATSTSRTMSIEACAGAAFEKPLGKLFKVMGSIKACAGQTWSDTHTETTSTSSGSESRRSASFSGGLRLPIAPVPEAPVGSLLAVLTPHGQHDQILDVRVVNRRDAIPTPALAGEEVDIFLLVNDVRSALCAPPADDSLILDMRVVTPVGLAAATVGVAMAQTIGEIEAQAPAILAQGGMTSHDATTLRAGAWGRLTQLLAAADLGQQGIPVELRSLYEAWIEKEIASIGRRGESDRVQREIGRVRLEVSALGHELSDIDAQSRLLDLIPRWRLRDLSGVELRPSIDTLGTILTDYVAPLFELRDPAQMSALRASSAAQLENLLDLDFADPLDEIGDDLRLFAQSARTSVAAAQFELPSQARRTVVLAFPRGPGACEVCDVFKQAPLDAAQRAWSGIEGPDHVGSFVVRATDLYAPSGGNAQLACGDVAPVVRRAAVFMLNMIDQGIDFSTLGRELPTVAGQGAATFSFPRIGSVAELVADDEAGVPLSLPVINGNVVDVLPRFGTSSELGAGAGISPLTTFDIDFTSFYTSAPLGFIDETVAVLLVMDVERRVSAQNSFVPGVCQSAVTVQAPSALSDPGDENGSGHPTNQ